MIKLIDKCHKLLFSEKNLKLFETAILFLAVTGFIAHLLLIYLNINYELDYLSKLDNLFTNPISALYTPFSFILIYEVFFLIYYLPRSFTTSIRKEYEIISLIMIRKVLLFLIVIDLQSQILNVLRFMEIAI